MSAQHIVRIALVVLWSGWLSYALLKRAIKPPKDRPWSLWKGYEVESVNRNWAVRIIAFVSALLILAIGLSVAFGK